MKTTAVQAAPKTVPEMFLAAIRKTVRTAEVGAVSEENGVTRIEWGGSEHNPSAFSAFIHSRPGYHAGTTFYTAWNHPNPEIARGATKWCSWTV
jgi:hypothetical protein